MDNLNYINYRVIGNGYPVIFLHGFLESLEMWRFFNLEEKFKCILVDLPGHGKTKLNSDATVSMSSMAKDVIKIIDLLELEEFSLVGHSMGGYVGLELIKQDVRCKKIVLLNSNFWEDSELKRIDRQRVAEIVKKNKDLFLYEAIPNLFNQPEKFNNEIKNLIAEARSMDAEAIGKISIAMSQRKSFEDYLSQFEQRLLIIQGQLDTIVPFDKMTEALVPFSNIQLEITTGGHMAHIENTIESQKIIEKFLE